MKHSSSWRAKCKRGSTTNCTPAVPRELPQASVSSKKQKVIKSRRAEKWCLPAAMWRIIFSFLLPEARSRLAECNKTCAVLGRQQLMKQIKTRSEPWISRFQLFHGIIKFPFKPTVVRPGEPSKEQ